MTTGIIIAIIVCLLAIVAASIFVPKFIKTPKQKRLCLLVVSLLTIAFHYSVLIYHHAMEYINPGKITTMFEYLYQNPNLLFPIYPCNVVMWGLLLLCFIKDEESKLFKTLVDFLFLFGIIAGVAGLIANGEYFNPYVVKDYDIYKSIIAHSFMVFNILCLPLLGYFKLDALKNTIRTTIGIAIMGLIGIYCCVIAYNYGGVDMFKLWNSMFLVKTPIESLPIVRFHIVMPMFIVILFGILTIIELIKKPKGERWFNKLKVTKK